MPITARKMKIFSVNVTKSTVSSVLPKKISNKDFILCALYIIVRTFRFEFQWKCLVAIHLSQVLFQGNCLKEKNVFSFLIFLFTEREWFSANFLLVIHIQKTVPIYLFQGASKGWSQSECDDRFYSDSRKVCDCKYKQWYQIADKGLCHAAALTMYGIVKAAGSNFYLKSSHDYCSNSCINDFSEGKSIFKK